MPLTGDAVVKPDSVASPGLAPRARLTGVVHQVTGPTPEPSRTATVTGAPVGRKTSLVMSESRCASAGWDPNASEQRPTRSSAGWGPSIRKSLPVPLKSFDCLTVVVNVYGACVGVHSACAPTLNVTDWPGCRERSRSRITPPDAVTVPAKAAWLEVRLRLAGSMVTPAGTARFADPRSCGEVALVSVTRTVGEAPAQ